MSEINMSVKRPSIEQLQSVEPYFTNSEQPMSIDVYVVGGAGKIGKHLAKAADLESKGMKIWKNGGKKGLQKATDLFQRAAGERAKASDLAEKNNANGKKVSDEGKKIRKKPRKAKKRAKKAQGNKSERVMVMDPLTGKAVVTTGAAVALLGLMVTMVTATGTFASGAVKVVFGGLFIMPAPVVEDVLDGGSKKNPMI